MHMIERLMLSLNDRSSLKCFSFLSHISSPNKTTKTVIQLTLCPQNTTAYYLQYFHGHFDTIIQNHLLMH